MSLLQLGSLDLSGFELPSRIGFGGAQQLAVHKLIGGARVLDALGRDDASLEWSGVLAGSDAADRARQLDAVRVAGELQTLTWNAFCYSVVVSKLQFTYTSPWWIPYRISCVVQRDLAQGTITSVPSASAAVLADLAFAGQLVGSGLVSQITAASSLVSSAASSALAAVAVAKVSNGVEDGIQAAQVGLQSDDVVQVVAEAGSLAQLCCARGFLSRSAANLAEIGV